MNTEKHHRQMKYADRLKLEVLYRAKHTIKEIADLMGFHVSTIYREVKRGKYNRMDKNTLECYETYSADIAEKQHAYLATSKGQPLKIAKDHNLVKYIETMIIENKQSPDAVIGRIRATGLYFETTICTRTLYRYINDGLFLNLTNKHLPMRGERKRKYKRVQVRAKNARNRSIEERPKEANLREFGHWEMDTVIGKKESKAALLVLTERKTRCEIIFKIREKNQIEVKRCIDKLERKYQKQFSHIFKTITCDNGSEFLNMSYIENSCIKNGKRTTVFYCHPYSAFERGSNENQNKMIRRFIPKGMDIGKANPKNIDGIQKWINNYPRRILNYNTSAELFDVWIKNIKS